MCGHKTRIHAISRTGVCVPEEVGLFGRTIVSYECRYTRDGRTQTGDEWEREICEAAANAQGRNFKKPKKEKKRDMSLPETQTYERFIIPPPYNTTGMPLREGEPYLIVSSWLPGLELKDLNVVIDYQEHANVTVYPSSPHLECSNDTLNYYSACEAIPPSIEQHEQSYNSTYNDLFNRMMEQDQESHYNKRTAPTKPPLLLISAPKNTIVKQWERATFLSRRQPENRNRYSKIQRACRPLAHVDLRNIHAVYTQGMLQINMRLTHIPPPANMRSAFKIPIQPQGTVSSPRLFPIETVHGWMYNWHCFDKYDLSFDLSKFDKSQVDPAAYEPLKIDEDADNLTRREIRKLIRDIDKAEKADDKRP
ncbi:hypothetical protein BdWA1_001098 [Babesia duncani]|uniref:Uncharacterized protein n=1 Tax=Babesia duncani TaxID=323732 RepID=A0AAD9PNM2_9APIC|nr:hypothetical protein BdWA1_001098 [Babesia duncani]